VYATCGTQKQRRLQNFKFCFSSLSFDDASFYFIAWRNRKSKPRREPRRGTLPVKSIQPLPADPNCG
jgi:hypothetical protein